MADYSRHVPGHASSNHLRSGYGQFSNQSRQSLFGVGNVQLYGNVMSTSIATTDQHESILNRDAPSISKADLSLKPFYDNLTAGATTLWKSSEPSVNGHLSQMQQYSIPSSDEAPVGQLVAPEEFDIPHLHATIHSTDTIIGPKQSYLSNVSNSFIQSNLSNPTSALQNISRESSRTGPVSTLTRTDSAQIHDTSGELSVTNAKTCAAAAGSRPAKTNSMSLGPVALTSMDSSETLITPQNFSTNNQTGASASTNMFPKDDMQTLGQSEGKRDENLSNISERDDANNEQMLLPNRNTSSTLPAGKVFPIQIGSELFKLSGASISSDAPSYFSQFFSEQLLLSDNRTSNIRTLYIDRDPATFKDILLHLQGYHIEVRDAAHFVRLFADAQFYSLPRLIRQLLYSEIHINIGDTQFQISRDLFSAPGDSPNYFTLGFGAFFSSPNDTFPGLDKQGLLRPPSIHPPSLPNRSAEVFKELLHYLKGYPVDIRSENHRVTLLKEARYFHFKGLEQRLLPHEISYSASRHSKDILLRLEDIRQSGISFVSDTENNSHVDESSALAGRTGKDSALARNNMLAGTVRYSRPYVDDDSYELVLETSDQATTLDLGEMRIAFSGQTKARVASLLQVIVNKMNLPTTQPLGLMLMTTGGGLAAQPASPSLSGLSDEHVRVRFDESTHIELDGRILDSTKISSLSKSTSNSHIGDTRSKDAYQSTIPVQRPLKRRKLDPVNAANDNENNIINNHIYDNSDNAMTVDNDEEESKGEVNNNINITSNDNNPRLLAANARNAGNGVHATSTNAAKAKKWTLVRAQWRIRIEPALQQPSSSSSSMTRNKSRTINTTRESNNDIGMEVIFYAVRLDALGGEKARNVRRGFLT